MCVELIKIKFQSFSKSAASIRGTRKFDSVGTAG